MSPNPITDRIDHLAQAVAERVVTLVVNALDLNALIAKVDVNAIVDRVDIDAIVEKIDIDAIVEKIDIDAIVQRVDIDEVVRHLDIDTLMEQTELGPIIARSTSSVLSEVLDVIRAWGVGLDDFFARWTRRLLRRRGDAPPEGPPLLVQTETPS